MAALTLLLALASGNLTFPDGGLPTSRPLAYAESGGKQVVGGLDGLFVGSPGSWVRADTNSVKQIEVDATGNAWIRRGDGAVDKLDIAKNRHYHDALFGASRRPWVASIGLAGKTVLFGGHGGWMEKSGEKELVDFYPAELKGQVVTALIGKGKSRWIGTQGSGLWRFGEKSVHFGLAAGLDDPWVTGLADDGKQLWIGTASDGLYALRGSKLSKTPAPFERVRSLALWKGMPLVATDLGVFLATKGGWEQLTKRESYAAISGKSIAILEPDAIVFRP